MSRKAIDGYLKQLVDSGGSDLHLRVGGQPRIRVNGVLYEIPATRPLLASDTKAIAHEVIRPHLFDRFQRGEEVDFAYTNEHGRFRVNAYLQRDTVAMVFRQVVTKPQTIEELGLPDRVRQFAEEARGLVLVAGPTGSGKTTTLAAMIDHINKTRPAHIVTIEDPIEVVHKDARATVSQRELGADTPSFAAAMRAALRQDPDVILVGEMRDQPTVATAMTAAETGHLVLSTLHTTDATETISRIIEFFPPNEQRQVRLVLAGVLKGTICQRLVPTIDGESRVPATEVMVVNGRIQEWIVNPGARAGVQEIIEGGEYYGMHTFDQSLIEMIERGLIDVRAALSAATSAHDMGVELRRRGIALDAIADDAPTEQERESESVGSLLSVMEKLTAQSANGGQPGQPPTPPPPRPQQPPLTDLPPPPHAAERVPPAPIDEHREAAPAEPASDGDRGPQPSRQRGLRGLFSRKPT